MRSGLFVMSISRDSPDENGCCENCACSDGIWFNLGSENNNCRCQAVQQMIIDNANVCFNLHSSVNIIAI